MKSLAKRAAAACLALMMAVGAYNAALMGSAGGSNSCIINASAFEASKDSSLADWYDIYTGLYSGQTWNVKANMVKADGDKSSLSMADAAIDHYVTVSYDAETAQYYVALYFEPITIGTTQGYLKSLSYYKPGYTIDANGNPVGEKETAEVTWTYRYFDKYNALDNDNDGKWDEVLWRYPHAVRFPIDEQVPFPLDEDFDPIQYIPLEVYVPAMEGHETQPVYLMLDWSDVYQASNSTIDTTAGSIEWPYIPVGGSETVTYEKYPFDPNAAEEETQQLADGKYKVNMYIDVSFSSPTKEPAKGLAKAVKDETELLVVDGHYYIIADIDGTSYTGLWVSDDSLQWTEYVEEGKEPGTYAKVETKGVMFESSNITINGTTEISDVYYPGKVGFELSSGKLNNGYQFFKTSYGYMTSVLVVGTGTEYKEQLSSNRYTSAIDWSSLELVESWDFEKADYTEVDKALASIPEDLSVYTDNSAEAVNTASKKVIRYLAKEKQDSVDAMAKEINDAVAALELKKADYTALDEAVKKAKDKKSVAMELFFSYSDESLKALNDALDAVVRDLDITKQDEVDAMTKAVNDAADALEKAADYSKVNSALKAVPEDLSEYSEETVKAVEDAKNAVIKGLGESRQDDVDAMAKAINDAVAALEKKSETKRLNGDVDNTGKVDTKDAMKIIAFAKKTHAPKDDEEFKYADVNHDGVIDSKDAMMVVAHVKGTKTLPD